MCCKKINTDNNRSIEKRLVKKKNKKQKQKQKQKNQNKNPQNKNKNKKTKNILDKPTCEY